MTKTTRNPKGFPAIVALRRLLTQFRRNMRNTYSKAELTGDDSDSAGIDVRLCVFGGSWSLHTGDSSYDQDHRGAWGCGFISWERQNLTELARELIADALSNYDDSADSDDSSE